MSKIDGVAINRYIAANKKKKPDYANVDQQEWEDALDGYQESFSNAVDNKCTTEQFWSLIYFSALAFCRGMERAEVKAGTRTESYYPRY